MSRGGAQSSPPSLAIMTDKIADPASAAPSHKQTLPRHKQDHRHWRQRLGKQRRDQPAQSDVLASLEKRIKRASQEVAKLHRLAKAAHKIIKQCAADHQQRPSSAQPLIISSPGLSPIGSPSTPEERKEKKTVLRPTLTAQPTTATSQSISITQPTGPVTVLTIPPSAISKEEEDETKALSLNAVTMNFIASMDKLQTVLTKAIEAEIAEAARLRRRRVVS